MSGLKEIFQHNINLFPGTCQYVLFHPANIPPAGPGDRRATSYSVTKSNLNVTAATKRSNTGGT